MKTKLIPALIAVTTLGIFVPVAQAAEDSSGSRPNREQILARFDANGDGKLDQAERAAAKEARAQRGKMRGRHLERFDTDGDGRLNDAEHAHAETTMRAEITQNPRAMARIDTDGDGQISDSEWAAGRAKMRERGGKGRPPRSR